MVFGTNDPLGTVIRNVQRAVCVLLLAAAGPTLSAAQSDVHPTNCTLPMPVPESGQIEFNLQSTLRGPGMLVSWPDLDPSVSTCTALLDTAGLGFPIELSGAYADKYDRQLRFQFTRSGTIGDPAANDFPCAWANVNVALSGSYEGRINLSNTGGLWIKTSGDPWYQHNEGLPIQSRFTNLVDIANSFDGQFLLAGLTSGHEFSTNPNGLYKSTAGGPWQPVFPDIFGTRRVISKIAMSPQDANHFAVGTLAHGLFVTTDGGDTFTQWTDNLDPDFSSPSTQYPVTALAWVQDRLYVAVRFYGVFFASAQDGYSSFTRLANLTVPDSDGLPVIPWVRCLAIDPSDPDRIVVGLTRGASDPTNRNGLYESPDVGQTWRYLHTTFVGLPGGDDPADRPKIPISLHIDPVDGRRMWMGTDTQGLWRTMDGGDTWYETASPFIAASNQPSVIDMASHEGTLYAQVLPRGNQTWGLHQWSEADDAWLLVEEQPYNRQARRILSTENGLLLPTIGGGIYVPGTAFSISSTLTSSPFLEFGLSLAFQEGSVTVPVDDEGEPLPRSFRLLMQMHQGWIVWRADDSDPDNMSMIGRFDLINPETCIEGYCGDESFVIDPECFGEKLAACFDFSRPGFVSFYDDNIFNGFTYHYAVTPFDYGDISLLATPADLAAPMVFPPRFPDDPYGQPQDDVPALGNRRSIQIHADAAPALDGQQVYVFPNPLRLGSGIAGGEGEEVVWTNLPPESMIQVFTLAGDHIADLPQPERPQQEGNIYWTTRNSDGQKLSAGIYIWKLIMPQRGDYWGKLVIIR
jgi:photosystem II stability/assembly factor-like uncharacterized protein